MMSFNQYIQGDVLFLLNQQLLEIGQLITSLKDNKNIKHLHLKSNNIGNQGAEALAKSKSLKNLTTLDLSWNRISDEGAEALAKSKNLRNLTTLNLGGNDIGDEGAKALAKSKNLKNLTTLDLGGNRISDEGAEALAKSKNLRNLTTLDLSWNRIGDEGKKALANGNLTNLTILHLRENNISSGTQEIPSHARRHNIERSRQVNKNKVLAVATTLAITAILIVPAALVAHFAFQASTLTTGAGTCCLIAAAVTYCANKPSSSLENSDAKVVTNERHAVA